MSDRLQRISVYGVHVEDDAILLVRASNLTEVAGRWFLPGGGVEHGEHPIDALVREVSEETGLDAVVGHHLGIVSDVLTRRSGQVVHTVRLIYALTELSGRLADETTGSSDLARYVPLDEARTLPLSPYVIKGAKFAGFELSAKPSTR